MTPDQERTLLAMQAVTLPPPPLDTAKVAKLLTTERPAPEAFDEIPRLLNATPRARQGHLIGTMIALGCHPWLCQLAMALAWTGGCGAYGVSTAAGDRATLKAWLKYCRFDWPCSEVIAEAITTWTPREMVVYRGGRMLPEELAQGLSWTPLKPIAAIYSIANPAPWYDQVHPPVIIRRTVTRAEIAFKFINGHKETVIPDVGEFHIDTTDEDELAVLAEEGRALNIKFEIHRRAWIVRHRARNSGNLTK